MDGPGGHASPFDLYGEAAEPCPADAPARGSDVVRGELLRAMREGVLRTLDPSEVVVTLTAKGRALALDIQRVERGQARLLRDLAWQARLQGGDGGE